MRTHGLISPRLTAREGPHPRGSTRSHRVGLAIGLAITLMAALAPVGLAAPADDARADTMTITIHIIGVSADPVGQGQSTPQGSASAGGTSTQGRPEGSTGRSSERNYDGSFYSHEWLPGRRLYFNLQFQRWAFQDSRSPTGWSFVPRSWGLSAPEGSAEVGLPPGGREPAVASGRPTGAAIASARVPASGAAPTGAPPGRQPPSARVPCRT